MLFHLLFVPFIGLGWITASKLVGMLFGALLLLKMALPIARTVEGFHSRTERMTPKLTSWLQQRIPVGSQVFTTEWGHTGTILLALNDRKFIVALDPILFLVKEPALYRLWYEIPASRAQVWPRSSGSASAHDSS